MHRKTKIVATLGPATTSISKIRDLISKGVDVFRVNFSHGGLEQHKESFVNVRMVAAQEGRDVAILADIQGPKIRISSFINGKVLLKEGQRFTLDPALGEKEGDISGVGLDYKKLYKDVVVSDVLRLGDGQISLKVTDIIGEKVVCESMVTEEISDHKGINLQGGGLSAGAITAKDIVDIETAIKLEADFVALSFVRSKQDIDYGRSLIEKFGGHAAIIAKIERIDAVKNSAEIIDAADGIMIARGDLAIEIGEAEVPGVQKKLVKLARSMSKPVIVATQMMESMIHQRVPTRAEVSDVANAVLDGADAVMLSAETAVGSFPTEVVDAVVNICFSAEKYDKDINSPMFKSDFANTDQAVSFAAMYIANSMNVAAIIALTESGKTPLLMSRVRSGIPIYGLSRHKSARRKMMLYRDVIPVAFDVTATPYGLVNFNAVAELEKLSYLFKGDNVILTKGDYMGGDHGSNAIKMLEVGEVRKVTEEL
ncbi:MAG: pyruvate kinase [Legionellales bacterium]|nr:pyruvate kinase [Legionellales bacterium]